MKQHLLILRETLRTSIWFIPALFCLASIALATTLSSWERDLPDFATGLKVWAMSATSAQHVLGIIAGSVLGVGGVVFSITMVALTLTSGQYGPKILRQFLGDNASKISLGLFIGTSLYCLISIMSYNDTDTPSASVLVALILTVLALASFIQFIHRTATDLQADKIIERIGEDLSTALQQLLEDANQPTHSSDILAWRRKARGLSPTLITMLNPGYIQTIDYPEIIKWCNDHGCVGLLKARAGDFLLPGNNLIKLYGCKSKLQPEDISALRKLLRSGPLRTALQDPEYPITQLNQVAARALSPGINDPGTAITCIDWFSMAVAQIIDCDLPGKVLLDTHQQPILLVRFTDFNGILQAFYAPARQFSQSNIPVLTSLMGSLLRLAELTTREKILNELLTHGNKLASTIESGDHMNIDLLRFRQRYSKLQILANRTDNNS